MSAPQTKDIKLVVVGDGAVGKTCLLLSYVNNEMPTEYNPTIFDNLTTQVIVDGEVVMLNLWDTAGQQDYDRLRPLSYPETDVFLICYSVMSDGSLDNVTTKWIPEVQYHCPEAPVILVGTKKDLLEDDEAIKETQYRGEKVVKPSQAETVAKNWPNVIYGSMDCSAKTRQGVKEVFDEAVRAYLKAKKKQGNEEQPSGCCSIM